MREKIVFKKIPDIHVPIHIAVLLRTFLTERPGECHILAKTVQKGAEDGTGNIYLDDALRKMAEVLEGLLIEIRLFLAFLIVNALTKSENLRILICERENYNWRLEAGDKWQQYLMS